MTVAWLRKRLEESATKCGSKIRNLQQALLSAAASVQHESANEPGEQLGVTGLPPEPFSWQQQKQSRMDGGQEDDGTLRDHVPIHAPLEQEHLAKERRAAAASNREPLKGTAAFREVPLTGAHQSSFPFYRSPGLASDDWVTWTATGFLSLLLLQGAKRQKNSSQLQKKAKSTRSFCPMVMKQVMLTFLPKLSSGHDITPITCGTECASIMNTGAWKRA